MPAASSAKAAATAAAAAVAAATAAAASPAASPRPHVVSALEAQGLVRVSLGPDEVNRDLSLILARLDQARASGGTAGGAAGAGAAAAAAAAAARKSDGIHSSRGILHFHNEVFEKGDSIIAFPPGKPATPKYAGVIQSVNGKEIMVRADRANAEGKHESHRIYVTHLRKNSINIAHFARAAVA